MSATTISHSPTLRSTIAADWSANPRNSRIRMVLILFRISNWSLQGGKLRRLLMTPWRFLYNFLAGWILGIDIPATTRVGPGLTIMHGYGLVIHGRAQIGANCVLRHAVTIGVKATGATETPVLGDDVDVGAAAQILGGIQVGSSSRIGAGSIVLKDVRSGSTVVGSPAREIGRVPQNGEG